MSMSIRVPVAAVLLVLFSSACHRRFGDDHYAGDGCGDHRSGTGPLDPASPGGSRGTPGRTPDGGPIGTAGGDDGAAGVASTGYCSSDSQCGNGWICDRTLGACALPRGGC